MRGPWELGPCLLAGVAAGLELRDLMTWLGQKESSFKEKNNF